MDLNTRIEIALKAVKEYEAGASTTEHFVALMHDWAVEIRPVNPALADRLAAVELRP